MNSISECATDIILVIDSRCFVHVLKPSTHYVYVVVVMYSPLASVEIMHSLHCWCWTENWDPFVHWLTYTQTNIIL